MLSSKQRRHLKGLGHHLKPIVQVGRPGISEAVIKQVDGALTDHELIKVKVHDGADVSADEAAASLAEATGAEVIQRLGHVALLYRRHPEEPKLLIRGMS